MNQHSYQTRPNRPVLLSFGAKVQLLLGTFPQVGWIFFSAGSVFFWVFGSLSDLQSL